MREYEDSFIWLADAKVVNPCYNATDPTVGMALSSDFSTMKLYMGDTGLLMTLALGDESATSGDLYKAIFTGDVYFNSGMIAENAVAQRTSGDKALVSEAAKPVARRRGQPHSEGLTQPDVGCAESGINPCHRAAGALYQKASTNG